MKVKLLVKHEIKTLVDRPLSCKLYRYPHVHEQEAYRQIEQMLQHGIIRKVIHVIMHLYGLCRKS